MPEALAANMEHGVLQLLCPLEHEADVHRRRVGLASRQAETAVELQQGMHCKIAEVVVQCSVEIDSSLVSRAPRRVSNTRSSCSVR